MRRIKLGAITGVETGKENLKKINSELPVALLSGTHEELLKKYRLGPDEFEKLKRRAENVREVKEAYEKRVEDFFHNLSFNAGGDKDLGVKNFEKTLAEGKKYHEKAVALLQGLTGAEKREVENELSDYTKKKRMEGKGELGKKLGVHIENSRRPEDVAWVLQRIALMRMDTEHPFLQLWRKEHPLDAMRSFKATQRTY